jgi:hypothetical protein
MSRASVFPTYKGRILGIVVLAVAQFTIGIIHVFFGFWLLYATSHISAQSPLIYSVYTLAFGVLTLFCAYGFGVAEAGAGMALLQFPCLLSSQML